MRILPSTSPRPEVLAEPRRPGLAPVDPAAIVVPSMPPALQDLLRDRRVLDVRLGHATLGQALADAIRFRFTGTGELSDRTIVPESDAASRLLSGANGAAVADALKGALSVLGARHQATTLAGITMSTSTDAFYANLLVTDAEGRLAAGEKLTARDVARTQKQLVGSGIDQAYGVYDGAGWMHLDPQTSREFAELVAAGPGAPPRQGELITTLQHELEHAVTPSSEADFAKVPWLEEATAETLTQWAGATAEMAGGMHLSQVSSGVIAYEPQVRELQGWLVRAGLDPKDPAQLGAVRDLLQGRSLGQVPRAIADGVIAHEGPGDAAALALQVEHAFAETAFMRGSIPGLARRDAVLAD